MEAAKKAMEEAMESVNQGVAAAAAAASQNISAAAAAVGAPDPMMGKVVTSLSPFIVGVSFS